MAELQHWEQTKALYLFTSLTAGSSHIITATSRIETILKNARIPFTYIDTATDESAKKLFQRRARGKKLPLLVKEGFVIADLDEVEEWNEFGELEENIGHVDTVDTSITTTPAKMAMEREGGTPSKPATVAADATPSKPAVASKEQPKKENKPPQQNSVMGSLAQEAAAKAKQLAKKVPTPVLASRTNESKGDEETSTTEPKNETPLSPSGIPLPMSPAQASPSPTNIDSAIKSPPSAKSPTFGHHRHNSTGSVRSAHFVPEKSEPEVREHRGSEISEASEEEIRRIEAECSIKEEDEPLDEEDEDAILFGDAEEDEDTRTKPKEDPEEKTMAAKPANRLSTAEPVLTPVVEEKASAGLQDKPNPLNLKGGAHKPVAVMESAGLTPKRPDDPVEDEEEEEESDEDLDEETASDTWGLKSEDAKEDTGNKKDKQPTDLVDKGKNELPSKAAETVEKSSEQAHNKADGTNATASSTTPSDSKLLDGVSKVKIEDQGPAKAKQAGDSVED